MVMMVLWGHISPQLMQKVMALMSADLKLHSEGLLDVNGIEKLRGHLAKGSAFQQLLERFQGFAANAKAAQAPKAPGSYEAHFLGQICEQCAHAVATHFVCCHL